MTIIEGTLNKKLTIFVHISATSLCFLINYLLIPISYRDLATYIKSWIISSLASLEKFIILDFGYVLNSFFFFFRAVHIDPSLQSMQLVLLRKIIQCMYKFWANKWCSADQIFVKCGPHRVPFSALLTRKTCNFVCV